jgi:hypothetical protein
MAAKVFAYPTARKRPYRTATLYGLERAGIPQPENCFNLWAEMKRRRAEADAEFVTVRMSAGLWRAIQSYQAIANRDEEGA